MEIRDYIIFTIREQEKKRSPLLSFKNSYWLLLFYIFLLYQKMILLSHVDLHRENPLSSAPNTVRSEVRVIQRTGI